MVPLFSSPTMTRDQLSEPHQDRWAHYSGCLFRHDILQLRTPSAILHYRAVFRQSQRDRHIPHFDKMKNDKWNTLKHLFKISIPHNTHYYWYKEGRCCRRETWYDFGRLSWDNPEWLQNIIKVKAYLCMLCISRVSYAISSTEHLKNKQNAHIYANSGGFPASNAIIGSVCAVLYSEHIGINVIAASDTFVMQVDCFAPQNYIE